MSRSVKAPEGFEGYVYYCDGVRGWMAQWRPVGHIWWKTGTYVGHAQMSAAEIDERAERAIAESVAVHTAVRP